MQGLAGSVTPSAGGKVKITVWGVINSSSGSGSGIDLQISYGTGSAPANAASLVGTQVGQALAITNAAGGAQGPYGLPFSMSYVVTLTPSTTYWIDLAAKANNATGVAIADVQIVATELP